MGAWMKEWRMRGSIFVKLFSILIVTGILLNVLLYFTLRFFVAQSPIKRDLFETFREENLKSFVLQIGSPPNVNAMNHIAEANEVDIRIEGNGQVWQTNDELPSLRQVERHQKREHKDRKNQLEERDPHPEDLQGDKDPDLDTPDMKVVSPGPKIWRGPPPHKRIPLFFDLFSPGPPRPAFIIKHDQLKFGFFLPDNRDFFGRYGKLIVPLLLVLSFLLASAFFAIRYVLLPLNALLRGVEAVAQGDLESRVNVRGSTEFERVAEAFNNMVSRIKETIEGKERLLIDVSHELQSPLARMKLAVELMKEEKTKERLKLNLKDLESMVSEILESARLDSSTGSLSLQKTDLNHLIKDFLYVYELMGTPVEWQESSIPVVAEIDPSRLIIVLRNLIENALKYADSEQKRVSLSLSEDKVQGHIRIEVSDNGSGIEAQELSRIFDPFYRVDKSRTRNTGGYGLGLSLCKRIVDAHRGTIGIESSNQGTKVWFTLPKES